jgi:hypothetical protein
MWGYQGWEDIEWWTCARAKENMTTRHQWRPRCQIAHGWKRVKVSSLNNMTSFLALYFSFTWFIPLISFLPLLFYLSLLFLSFFHSHIFPFLFFSIYFSFPYSYFYLYFSLSWHLFLTFETLRVGCVQGMRCTKEMYRVGYGIRWCTGLPMWKSRYRIHDEASNKR